MSQPEMLKEILEKVQSMQKDIVRIDKKIAALNKNQETIATNITQTAREVVEALSFQI